MSSIVKLPPRKMSCQHFREIFPRAKKHIYSTNSLCNMKRYFLRFMDSPVLYNRHLFLTDPRNSSGGRHITQKSDLMAARWIIFTRGFRNIHNNASLYIESDRSSYFHMRQF